MSISTGCNCEQCRGVAEPDYDEPPCIGDCELNECPEDIEECEGYQKWLKEQEEGKDD